MEPIFLIILGFIFLFTAVRLWVGMTTAGYGKAEALRETFHIFFMIFFGILSVLVFIFGMKEILNV